jgi:class 3 adenylate cyclase/predicted ATPase
MIQCSNPLCLSQNPDGSNFCGKCGTRLPQQGTGLLLEATSFCRACGTRRERYPNDRRNCTILFADVHGYTAMSERLKDVEKITEIMNDVFARLTEKIVDMGGSIDKYSGDAIMARFGAPESHEDDPERAVRAALAMQHELRKISRDLQTTYGFGLDMRIGLNTGEVSAAEVGGEVRGISYKTYTVMGDSVNLASRLEHEARIGHILVGELTHKLSQHAFEFIDMGVKQIRGKKELVHCYEVVGPKQERKNRRGLAGRDLPLIGRERELATLWERLQMGLDGRAQVVSIVGEAGVGKSSLLREFKRRINAFNPEIWYLSGAAFSYSSGQYFSLVRTIVFKYCKINDNEEEAEIRRKLLLSIEELTGEKNDPNATEFGEYAALMGQIAGVSMHNAFIDGLDPQKRNNLLIEAVSDFLLNKSQSNPLVLVLDDLHWVDVNSLKVIDRVVAKVTLASANAGAGMGAQVMLLLLHRPDFSRIWPVSAQAADSYEFIMLERLTPHQMEPLVRQFLEEWVKVQEPDRVRRPVHHYAPLPAEIMGLVERANGNAFFAEEILKQMLENGQLVPDDESDVGWHLEGSLDEIKPPETLQEILLTRVDNLEPYDKRVLQVAAVIGNRFEGRILDVIPELGAPSIIALAIANLQRRDLIAIERTEPEIEHTFRHYLTREVAYNNLLGVERSRYHEQVAEAIEMYKADRLRDYTVVDDLAYHYERSNNEEKAAHYLLLAGNMRQSLFRNDEALKAFYQAQEILSGEPFASRPDGVHKLIQIDSAIADILALKGEFAESISYYESALARCTDPVGRIDLQARLIEVLGKTIDHERALAVYEQAKAEFDKIPEGNSKTNEKMQHLRAKLLIQIAWIYLSQGRYDDALLAYQVSLTLLDSADTSTNQILKVDRSRAYAGLGQLYSDKADLTAAEECLIKAAQLQEETGKLDSLGRTYNGLGFIEMMRGNLVKADVYLRLSRDNAQRSGDVQTAAAVTGGLGIIALRQGRLELALKHFRTLEKSPSREFIANAQIYIGQILSQQGRYDEALAEFDKAIRLARFELRLDQGLVEAAEIEQDIVSRIVGELGDPLLVGQLERLQGRLAFLKGDYNGSIAAFESSMNSLEAVKAYLEMSYTKLHLARTLLVLYSQTGNPLYLDDARTYLMQSASTFEACDVIPRQEEAELLLRELGEPSVAA